jgi:flagella basal body P-ring formation protein FlgA
MKKIPPIFDKRQGLAAGLIQFKWLLLMACLWLISLSSQAAPWHAHEAIYQAVSQFSQQQLGSNASTKPLDERSRYALCTTPLQVTLPFNNQKTVKVVCEKTHDKTSWSLYLSINVQTNIKAWRLLIPIAEQGTITAKHIALVTYTGNQSNFMGSDTNPIGQQVKRRLNKGDWLSPEDMNNLQTLWRAAEDIPQGQVIALKHLTSSKEPVQTASPSAVSSKAQLIGKIAKRYIKTGKLLDKNDIEGQQLVVISNQALSRGRELIAQDLALAWVPEHSLRQIAFSQKEALVGWVTKRYIASQTPLTKDMLRKAYLVIKGSQVSLQINLDNYQITNKGQALSNGGLGDKIKVKLSPSGLVKEGLVIAKGQVELSR